MKKTLSLLIAIVFVFSVLAPAALAEGEDTLSTALSYIFPADGPRDPSAALELLLPLAEAGDAEAQYYCGWIYDFELEENMDTELQAYNWYVPAAEQGHIKAGLGAAFNSFAQSSEPLDNALSSSLLEMSDEELGADGLYWIGFMYYNGMGLEQDYDKAFEYFLRSADMNSVLAMNDAATLAYDGFVVAQDTGLALELYEKAAALNSASAMCSLGYHYYLFAAVYSPQPDQDYKQAFDWYRKAAELGDAEAMSQLAMMYQNGEGTEENPELAFEWYSRAVELGDTHAMCMLGHMYRDGDWVEQDYDKAMNYFIEAAVNGNTSAPYVVEMMKAYNEGMDTYYAREAEYLAATAD